MQELFDFFTTTAGDATHPQWWKTLLDIPLKIVLILLAAAVVRLLAIRFIQRIVDRIASGRGALPRADERTASAAAMLSATPVASARREARARSTASILQSATTAVVAITAMLSILQVLDVGFTPALSVVSVAGVALGLGAQAVIKDVIAGLSMLIEDQYGVGDVVDLGEVVGTVESVGLRVTRLRDADGTIWYLRNGEVARVGNRSQGSARAVLDAVIAAGQDVARAQDLLLDAATSLAKEDDFSALLSGEPQMWGVQGVSADGVVVRLVVPTQPLQQWAVARELRRRILDRFAAEGLPLPTGLVTPDGTTGPKAPQ